MSIGLIIMAAGIGSRFGENIKQLAPIGTNGETLIDYAIADAVKAGFKKIVFVIRKDIENIFLSQVMNKAQHNYKNIQFNYAFQEINNIPIKITEERKKPWGTGQAVLSARNFIDGPFVAINADDYYGFDAFKKVFDFLTKNPNSQCMVGYRLKNTVLENATVTRGICQTNNDIVLNIKETKGITRINNNFSANGIELDENNYVSMNIWGFPEQFINILEKGFLEFFDSISKDEILEKEYLLPVYINKLIEQKAIKVKLIPTEEECIGITHIQDVHAVKEYFLNKIQS